MNITPISASVFTKQNSFKSHLTPEQKVTSKVKDDEIVGYSNWGGNYHYPILAGQLREKNPKLPKFDDTTERSYPFNREIKAYIPVGSVEVPVEILYSSDYAN